MKKNIRVILIFVGIMILLVGCAVLAVIQYNNDHVEQTFSEFGKTTYTFVGDSEHFSFDTGKVFFKTEQYESEYNKKLIISDFEQTSKIDGLISEKLTLYFGDKVWKSINKQIGLNKINEVIEDFVIVEEDVVTPNNKKINNKSVFENFTKDNFKSALKIEIEYCMLGGECEIEVFDIDYKD